MDNKQKIIVGSLLLAISTLLIFGAGPLGLPAREVAIGVAALGLAAGALLVGTSEDDRPV